MKRSVIIVFSVVAIFCGCGASTVEKKMTRLRFSDDIAVSYPQNGFDTLPALVQQIVFEQGTATYEFTAMVELTEGAMTIAGLSPLGDRQFLMTLNGNEFRYESQMMFDLPFPPQYLARDFLLIYSRPETLMQQLPGLEIHDRGSRREIDFQGARQIEIERATPVFAPGDIRFVHLKSGYNIHISTVQVDFPNEVVTSDETQPSP